MRGTLEKFLIAGIELAFFQADLFTKFCGVPWLCVIREHFQSKLSKSRIKTVSFRSTSMYLMAFKSPCNRNHKLLKESILVFIGK